MKDHAHLGGVVFRWGRLEQNHLVAAALVPAYRELERAGLAEGFLFDRFDSRGPHLFFLWTVPRSELAEITGRLASQLEKHLAEHPGTTELSEDALATHHAGCRGKTQCEIDRLPGFGTRDAVHLFEHPADGYPFFLTRGRTDASELWARIARLSLWAAENLKLRGDGIAAVPAFGYLLAVDREARRRGWTAEYWRHHACSLILGLRQRLAENADGVLEELPQMIGGDNLSRLARIWASSDRLPQPEGLGALLDLAVPPLDTEDPNRFLLLREIGHLVLKQLGFPVPRHVPPVLYAWLRAGGEAASRTCHDE